MMFLYPTPELPDDTPLADVHLSTRAFSDLAESEGIPLRGKS